MPVREDPRAQGQRRGRRLVLLLATEWRELRLSAGLSQRAVARAAGISRSSYARIEQGRVDDVGLVRAASVASILGTELGARLYPAGSPVRDVAHLSLLADLDARLASSWRVTNEAPIAPAGASARDRRAWDRLLDGPVTIGVEAETRLRDVQALERAMQLKLRDSGVRRMVLVVRGSTRNRALVREHLAALRPTFPLGTTETLRALRDGRDPGANGLVLL